MRRIILTPVKAYEVTIEDGEKLGQFMVGTSWHGMMELKNGHQTIIFDSGQEFVTILDNLFGMEEKPKTVHVVKASPPIMDMLNKGPKPKMPEPLSAAEVAELRAEENEQ